MLRWRWLPVSTFKDARESFFVKHYTNNIKSITYNEVIFIYIITKIISILYNIILLSSFTRGDGIYKTWLTCIDPSSTVRVCCIFSSTSTPTIISLVKLKSWTTLYIGKYISIAFHYSLSVETDFYTIWSILSPAMPIVGLNCPWLYV